MMDEQEKFWAGEFGDAYTERNSGAQLVAYNTVFFSRALAKVKEKPKTILELGANRGLNILALRTLLPNAKFSAVEINEHACRTLEALEDIHVQKRSVYEVESSETFDLVFTKTLLIHLNPAKISQMYSKLFDLSHRYILVAEYYNPRPEEVSYRGNSGVLFRRDFAGELLDAFSSLMLVDYGFSYHRDVMCAQDDISWFLLEKKPSNDES